MPSGLVWKFREWRIGLELVGGVRFFRGFRKQQIDAGYMLQSFGRHEVEVDRDLLMDFLGTPAYPSKRNCGEAKVRAKGRRVTLLLQVL
jgi:hypothetical protein